MGGKREKWRDGVKEIEEVMGETEREKKMCAGNFTFLCPTMFSKYSKTVGIYVSL